MAKFLIKGSYEAAGTRGLLKEGGTGRKAAITKAVEGLGGKVESVYFALGDADTFLICDMPDVVSGIALSLNVNASGLVRISTTPLLTVEDIDAAVKKTVSYRAPGA